MEVGNRFQAITNDPLERLIRVHTESLATAMRNRQAREAASVARECDARQGRIVLNAARREIDRLRRGLFRAAEAALLRQPVREILIDAPSDPAPEPRASPPAERKSYAPAPIGQPTVFPDATPPDPSEVVRVVNPFHVTNLGTLLDILA
ncbi:MAG: hypothetical protein ACYS0G_01045 [Planctomycetota bacterium]|jgi:hypothetical protein